MWKNVKEEYFGDGCKRFSENDCIEAVEKKLTIDDDLTHIERAHGYLESLFKVVDSLWSDLQYQQRYTRQDCKYAVQKTSIVNEDSTIKYDVDKARRYLVSVKHGLLIQTKRPIILSKIMNSLISSMLVVVKE